MIALAVGRAAGADPARAVAALATVQLPAGRGTAIERGGLLILDDTYNANPASVRWAVKFAHWLAARRRRPLAVVVGSMLELGAESDRLHAAVAGEIAGLEPAVVAAVGAFVPAFEPWRGGLGARPGPARGAGGVGARLQTPPEGGGGGFVQASRGG